MIRLVFALLVGAVALAGCTAPTDSPPSQPPAVVTDWQDPPEPTPTAVRIAAIGAASSLIPTGMDAAGGLVVPDAAEQASWWEDSPRPGETGPAVILGHVNNHGKPGVFARLGELKKGSLVEVTQSTGNVLVFEVYDVARKPKATFSSWVAGLLANTRGPELRVISCGGRFDPVERSYTDNVIAYARELP